MHKRLGVLVSVWAILAVSGCDHGADSAATPPAQQAEVPAVNVPAVDHGRTPTCAEFVEHVGALIDATGRPNPHFNASVRPQAIASCERANNLEANATEARCVMRATSPQGLGDCGNGQFMRQW